MRKWSLYKGLWKPTLILGCERIPWFIIAAIGGLIAMESNTWTPRILAVVLSLILFSILRMINNKEPMYFKLMYRYITFQRFYLNVAKYPSSPRCIKNF